jgi:hypothetical protein
MAKIDWAILNVERMLMMLLVVMMRVSVMVGCRVEGWMIDRA